jgi:hypothetical protein
MHCVFLFLIYQIYGAEYSTEGKRDEEEGKGVIRKNLYFVALWLFSS